MYWRRFVTGVEAGVDSAAAISMGHCSMFQWIQNHWRDSWQLNIYGIKQKSWVIWLWILLLVFNSAYTLHYFTLQANIKHLHLPSLQPARFKTFSATENHYWRIQEAVRKVRFYWWGPIFRLFITPLRTHHSITLHKVLLAGFKCPWKSFYALKVILSGPYCKHMALFPFEKSEKFVQKNPKKKILEN